MNFQQQIPMPHQNNSQCNSSNSSSGIDTATTPTNPSSTMRNAQWSMPSSSSSSSSPSSPSSSRENESAAASASAAMMMTASFEKVVKLNNLGVVHLDRGEPAKAAKVLASAFSTFKRTYQQQRVMMMKQQQAQQQEQQQMNEQNQGDASPTDANSVSSSSTSSNDASAHHTMQSWNMDDLFSRRRRFVATKKRSTLDASSADDSTTSRSSSSSSATTSFSGCSQRPQNCSSIPQQHEDNEDERTEVSIYSNPIQLPFHFPITKDSCAFLSTSITFNLALANQLTGIELWDQYQDMVQSKTNDDSCTTTTTVPADSNIMKHLQSAGRLYEYTIRLERARSQQQRQQQQSPTSSSSSPLFVSPFVLMAILTNLGHLHQVLGNVQQAKKCFSQLQVTLLFLSQQQQQRATQQSSSSQQQQQPTKQQLHQDMMELFMENAMIGLGMTQLMAAAA